MTTDPTETNPDFYRVLFENDRVRVLEYNDQPGDSTTTHSHPDSVMVALSDIHRRLTMGEHEREVRVPTGTATWLPAQSHSGHNIGETPTRAIFIELKSATGAPATGSAPLGPNV
jgi:hypothetical protein